MAWRTKDGRTSEPGGPSPVNRAGEGVVLSAAARERQHTVRQLTESPEERQQRTDAIWTSLFSDDD